MPGEDMSELERRHIKDVADNAQLRSIETKRKNGWKLLPEDEEFLERYTQEKRAEEEREAERLRNLPPDEAAREVKEQLKQEHWKLPADHGGYIRSMGISTVGYKDPNVPEDQKDFPCVVVHLARSLPEGISIPSQIGPVRIFVEEGEWDAKL
jgi:hypothetical protein